MGTEEILYDKIQNAQSDIEYLEREIIKHIKKLTETQARKDRIGKEKAQLEKDLEIIMKSRQNKEE